MCPSFDMRNGVFTFLHNTTSRPQQGTQVNVQCTNGKAPREGATTATCAENGAWFPSTLGCGGKCSGLLTLNSLLFRKVEMLLHRFQVTKINQQRIILFFVCLPDSCPALNLPPQVLSNTPDRFPGATVQFHCEGSYSFAAGGPLVITCLTGGRWSANPPTCLPGESSGPTVSKRVHSGPLTGYFVLGGRRS